jgi:hypothetical protein
MRFWETSDNRYNGLHNNPSRERIYRTIFGLYIVHWEDYFHEPFCSGITPRHAWRLSREGATWTLAFHYGVAPHNSNWNKEYEISNNQQ